MAETVRDQADTQPPAAPPVVVKKYANRRLYNTETSCYITLDNLAEMVRQGRNFVVYDAKSGEDITRSVLTQIIVEEEGKGRNLLPINFLRHLIGFYGGQMQAFVPRYLEQSMEVLAQQQDQMRNAMQRTMGTLFPFGGAAAVSEMNRQNVAMMERALSLFSPFYRPPEGQAEASAENEQELAAMRAEADALREKLAEAARLDQELATLRAQMEQREKSDEALRGQLDAERRKLAEAAEREKELEALRSEVEAQRQKLAAAAAREKELEAARAELEAARSKAAVGASASPLPAQAEPAASGAQTRPALPTRKGPIRPGR